MIPAFSLKQLWNGQLPLAEAFWRYAINYGLILNIAATITALALVLAGAPIVLAAIAHFLPLPYSLFAATGAWRSADHYGGNPLHASLAKLALAAWIVFWLIF